MVEGAWAAPSASERPRVRDDVHPLVRRARDGAVPAKAKETPEAGIGKRTMIHEFMRQIGAPRRGGGGGT